MSFAVSSRQDITGEMWKGKILQSVLEHERVFGVKAMGYNHASNAVMEEVMSFERLNELHTYGGGCMGWSLTIATYRTHSLRYK